MRPRYALIILLSSILLLPSFTSPVASQPALLAQRTWGGGINDSGNGVAVDSSGNVYVTGRTYSFGAGSPTYSDVVLVKYDASDSLVWQRTWGGSSTYEAGQGVAVDSFGNVYVTGLNGTGVPGSANIVLLKFDSTGLLLWQKTWGTSSEDQTGSVAVDSSSGSIYVAGYAGFGAGGQDFVLLKFDSSGGLLWQKTWGGPSEDRSWSVAVDSSGSIYATGSTFSFGAGGRDVVLLKFDSSGALLWHKMWGGTGTDDGLGSAVDSSGNIYVTGSTSSFGAGGADAVLLKFDTTGAFLWQKTWGGSGADSGQGVAVTSGSIYVTGSSDSFGAGLADSVLLRFDSSGGLVWQKVWGGIDNDYGLGVAVGPSGSVVVTGYVSEAQPYTLESPTATPQNPSFSASPTGSSTLGTPTFPLSSPAHTPGAPSGSQTYAGGNDLFLLRYSDFSSVTFQTSPSIGGITFNGVTYTNGQSGNYTSGEFTATVNVPFGYAFASWTASGGITVGSTTTNPTTVTVSGPGTLTANLTPTALSALLDPLTLVLVAVIAAAIVAVAIFFLRKRKRPSPPK